MSEVPLDRSHRAAGALGRGARFVIDRILWITGCLVVGLPLVVAGIALANFFGLGEGGLPRWVLQFGIPLVVGWSAGNRLVMWVGRWFARQ